MVGLHIWERKANSFPFLERYLQVGLQKRKSAGGFIPNREETAVFWGKRLPKREKGLSKLLDASKLAFLPKRLEGQGS